MARIPPLDGNVLHAPHVVLVGAGASIAARQEWGGAGPLLPAMNNLIDSLGLRPSIEAAGFAVQGLNFESFYDDLASSGAHPELKALIESRVYEYFHALTLPERPTIYDYLVLALREKDIIATFNWDPFLLKAYMRNEVVTKSRRPRIAFLHGNVLVGVCERDRTVGVNGRSCSICRTPFVPSKLLYPVKHKNYSEDPFIADEWRTLKQRLGQAYFLTVFGYSAPLTDVEARELMLEDWKKNEYLEFAEVEVIDIQDRETLEAKWDAFFFSHHYMITDNIFHSYLFKHPRRSCDAFAAATLMCEPWHDNPFPRFDSLVELQQWVRPLVDEEVEYDSSKKHFSGNPIPPNEKVEL